MSPARTERVLEERMMPQPKSRGEAGSQDDSPLLLKVKDAAKMLGLSRTKVYEMIASGELPVVRIGTAVRVPRQRLLEWIEENTRKAA